MDYSEDQLIPFKTPRSNAVLKGPPDTDIGDLDVELTQEEGTGHVVSVSAWGFDERTQRLVAAGAHIRLMLWQHPIPPIAIAVEAPFCANDGSEMVWVRAEQEFVCTNCDPRVHTAGSNGTVTPLDEAHADFEPADD